MMPVSSIGKYPPFFKFQSLSKLVIYTRRLYKYLDFELQHALFLSSGYCALIDYLYRCNYNIFAFDNAFCRGSCVYEGCSWNTCIHTLRILQLYEGIRFFFSISSCKINRMFRKIINMAAFCNLRQIYTYHSSLGYHTVSREHTPP